MPSTPFCSLFPHIHSLPCRAIPITVVSDLLLLLVLTCAAPVLTAHYPLCRIIMSCLTNHSWPSTSARSPSLPFILPRSLLSAMVIKACQRSSKLLHIIALWLFFLFQCRIADSVWGTPWWHLSNSVFSDLSFSVFTEKCSKSTPADNKKQEKDRKEESVANLDEAVQRIWSFEGKVFLVQNMLLEHVTKKSQMLDQNSV